MVDTNSRVAGATWWENIYILNLKKIYSPKWPLAIGQAER